MKSNKWLWAVFAAAALTPPLRADFCPALAVDAATDRLMYRIASRYGVALPASFFSQPMTACDVLAFLDKADSLSAAGRLLPAEAYDVAKLKKRVSASGGLLKWKAAKTDAHVNVHLDLTDTNALSAGKTYAGYVRGTAAPALNANLKGFSFYSGIEVWTDYRSDTMYHQSSYQPYDGMPYNLYGRADSSRVRSSDLLRGGIVYVAAPFRLDVGIDRIKQGPAVASPLTFSGYAPPETYARGELSFGVMDYTQMVGKLESEKDKPKYFYAHRLNVPLLKNRLTLGLTEVVINGSTTNQEDSTSQNALRRNYYGVTRDWEIAYMIPFVPYVFMEHYLGDRDNKNLSFDFNLAFPDDFRWYGELFLDDITAPWTMFSDDWGNKWAFTVGGQYFGSVFSREITASAEYSRVRPWVYTHFYGGSHRYDNFNVCLGAPLGPNSDLLSLSCEMRVTPRNALGISFTNARTDTAQRGGRITDVFQDSGSAHPDSPRADFLAGGSVRNDARLGLYWAFDEFGLFRVNVRYDYDFSGYSIFRVYGGLYF
jgi:hypothetical protein